MTRHQYDNDVHPDNVYGHTLDLLRRHTATPGPDERGVHLDVACGFGNIAEHVRDELGLEYVGLDVDPDELAALSGRGFETHQVDLMASELADRLDELVAGRRVVSVTFLDGLEHLVDGSVALRALAALVADHDAFLVTSVPNVTHLDVAIKALLGRWDYTLSGLLDHTHYRLWSARSLLSELESAGLSVFDRSDVEMEHSDQHFPADHLGLSSASSVGSWLTRLRRGVEPHGFTNQFVWASRAATTPPDEAGTPTSQDAPFMSFLVRTTGRPESLDETLLSLAAQTDTDFEAIVLAEQPATELDGLRALLAEHPATLRDRLTVVPAKGTPAEVLGAGLAAARGSYVALADDVTWLGHWVEAARAKARDFPGRCIRGLVLEQKVSTVHVGGVAGLRATGAPELAGGESFSVTEHLAAPLASTYGHAFPRSLFSDLGVGFEDAFGTASERRHLLRAVELAGVVEVGDIVAIHQVQEAAEPRESADDHAAMVEAVSTHPYLMPAGWATGGLAEHRMVAAARDAARAEVDRLQHLVSLKDDHITNLERIQGERDERLERLQGKLAKRDEQVARLRGRLAKHGDQAEQAPAQPDTDADSSGRGRWFRGRS